MRCSSMPPCATSPNRSVRHSGLSVRRRVDRAAGAALTERPAPPGSRTGDIAAATLETVRQLPPEALDASVDGEFSYLQTLRHLVFAIDRWITGPVLGEPEPFHRLGYPYASAPAVERAPLDVDATPSLDEVLAVRAERTGFVDRIVRDATDESLAREVPSPNGGTATVGDCVRVVLGEEWWHHHYANRDLATFTQTTGGT